jgi:hypothetical protein
LLSCQFWFYSFHGLTARLHVIHLNTVMPSGIARGNFLLCRYLVKRPIIHILKTLLLRMINMTVRTDPLLDG